MTMNEVATVKGVCLDLDGTLYSQPGLRKAVAVRLLLNLIVSPRKHCRALRIISVYRRTQESLRGTVVGTDIAEAQLTLTCELTGESREIVVKCINKWFEEAPLPLLPRFMKPGLLEFLAEARRRGIKLAVVSDYPARAKLSALGVSEYFDVIVCAQDPDVQRFKPDPTGLQVALRRLGVEKQDAVYVGDRASVDGEAARRAGIRSAIIGRSSAKTAQLQVACSDFRQLARIILQ